MGAAVWLPANLALVLVVLGSFPDQEAALYIAAAVLFLLFDSVLLLMMVFRVGFPRTDEPPEATAGAPGVGLVGRASGERVLSGPRRGPGGREAV